MKSKDQTINYCAPYAHHQNGIAERFIRTIEERSRVMLIFAMTRWNIITPNLWPYAVLLATDIYNHIPTKTREPPINMFSQRQKADISQFHVFGSPVYILKKNFQAGKPLSK